MVNGFQKVRVEPTLFPYYILKDILDDDTTDGVNGIIDNNVTENYDHDDTNKNNDGNNHNDNNDDDNDSNYDTDNGDLTIIIFDAIHFGETYICEKPESSAHTHICITQIPLHTRFIV